TSTRASGTSLAETTTINYDQQGRRTSIVYGDNTALNFGYNLLGQLIGVTNALGARTVAYNNQGLRTSVSTAAGTVQRTVFDIEDNPATLADTNGMTYTQGFDWLGRLLA